MNVLMALWHQDFNALLAPGSAMLIYICVGTLIFLESGFLPAAPFPCDSLVILCGTLAAVGVLNPAFVIVLLILCAAIGSLCGYLQGRWLNKLPRVQGWVASVPDKRMQQVDKLLGQHGLIALFVARFLPVVRSLLPLMMGMRVENRRTFHYFSWLSAVMWVLLLVGFGYVLPTLPTAVSSVITMVLVIAPAATFCVGFCSWLYFMVRRKLQRNKDQV